MLLAILMAYYIAAQRKCNRMFDATFLILPSLTWLVIASDVRGLVLGCGNERLMK